MILRRVYDMENRVFRSIFFRMMSRFDRFDSLLHEIRRFLDHHRENIKDSGIYWDEVLSQNRHYIQLLQEINSIIEEELKIKTMVKT